MTSTVVPRKQMKQNGSAENAEKKRKERAEIESREKEDTHQWHRRRQGSRRRTGRACTGSNAHVRSPCIRSSQEPREECRHHWRPRRQERCTCEHTHTHNEVPELPETCDVNTQIQRRFYIPDNPPEEPVPSSKPTRASLPFMQARRTHAQKYPTLGSATHLLDTTI